MISYSTVFNWTITAAEKATGVDAKCIVCEQRTARASTARMAIFYILHSIGWPAERTARYFHGEEGKEIDISTVTYAIKRATTLCGKDCKFSRLCKQIRTHVDDEKKSVRTVSIGLRYSR